MFKITIAMAKELLKSKSELPKNIITNIEDFIARGIGKLPIDTKFKKLVLGRGDIKDAKGNIKKQLSFKDTPGETTGKKITKNTKDKAADIVKIGSAFGLGVVAGPKFNNAFQAALGDSKSIFSGPDSPTMAQLKTRTLKLLKERKDNNIKKAIAAALKEVNGVPQKRPTPVRKAASKKYVTGLPDSYKKYKGGMAKKKK